MPPQPSLLTVLKNWIASNKILISIVILVMILMTVVTSEKILDITENPAFCGKNCHIMRPYYDSWRTSSHNHVKCVECHYEPGIIGHIKGKINGLSQFYKYETTTDEYSGELYAKVLDANCLSCHKKRIKSNVKYNDINFSHMNHLFHPIRNITLTCTSCHSMIVIGMKQHRSVTDPSCAQCHPKIARKDLGHVIVTTSTCFTCHFRDVPANNSISGCTLCHGSPKVPPRDFPDFNHTKHLSRGLKCLDCHTNISTGANDIVPKTKCNSCHTSKGKIEKYDDFKFMHKTHVTNNKIACYNCHSEVKHAPTVKKDLCTKCHGNQHPKDWLKIHKDNLFTTGKLCNDCHKPSFCTDCHAIVVTSGENETNSTNI